MFSLAYHGGTEGELMIDVEIGPRLLAARRRAGLTVRALASEIGVSAALISQIETGRTQPSVTTLYALVERLDVSLDWLIGLTPGGQPPEGPIGRPLADAPALRRSDAHPVLQIANGVRWEVVSSSAEGAAEAVHVTYQPGAASSPHGERSTHDGIESAYLIDGTLTVQLDDDEFQAGAGDSIVFDSRRPHRYLNDSAAPVRGVWITTGASHLP
jgi:transcriptional regulator with XRE-family HTH domain